MNGKSIGNSPRAADVALGARIKKYRLAAGLSQSALGQALGITFQQIQKYEKGSNRIAASRLRTVAETLGCSILDLADEGDDGELGDPMDVEVLRFARRLNGLPAKLRKTTIAALSKTTDAIVGAAA